MTEDDIFRLLTLFYSKARQDDLLGPVFAAVIKDEDWPEHIRIIHDFWSSVMLHTRRYHRNPMAIHARIKTLTPPMFERWLSLFRDAALQTLNAEDAEAISGKASMIGRSLQAGLFFQPAPSNPGH